MKIRFQESLLLHLALITAFSRNARRLNKIKICHFFSFKASVKRARQDDAVTAEPQVVDSSRYESIISHFANTDKTTFNNNSNIVDNDLTTAYNGSSNGIESSLALLDLIHIFSNNVSIIRGVSTPDRPTDGSSSSGNDKTLEEKRETLLLAFQP